MTFDATNKGFWLLSGLFFDKIRILVHDWHSLAKYMWINFQSVYHSHALCFFCGFFFALLIASAVKTGNGIPSPAALAAHRQRGMEDCLQDIRHYLMEVESIAPRDPSLVALLAHLRFWTRSKEEEAAAAHTATADKQSDAHDQSLDSFPGSSLESTPSIPSNIQPQPKRLLGRPSDLLQAAAALRSPSEPSFLSPTAHEYSSGLDLISSVAQQSSLATSTEKAVQLPSRTSSQQVEVLVPVLNSQNSQDQQPLRQQSAEETPRRAVVVMPLAANSQQATASSGEASHLAFPVESLPYIEPMASSQAQPTVLAPMTASWSSHVLAQTTSQASASSGSAVSVAVPQQGSSGHSVMNPNVQGGQEWK